METLGARTEGHVRRNPLEILPPRRRVRAGYPRLFEYPEPIGKLRPGGIDPCDEAIVGGIVQDHDLLQRLFLGRDPCGVNDRLSLRTGLSQPEPVLRRGGKAASASLVALEDIFEIGRASCRERVGKYV